MSIYSTLYKPDIKALMKYAPEHFRLGYEDKDISISQTGLKALDSNEFRPKVVWDCFRESYYGL